MPQISHNMDYIHVMVAQESGLTPGEFRLLSWEEQAEMIGFHIANQRVQQYYQEYHEKVFKRRMAEADAKSQQGGKTPPRGAR